MQLIINRKNYNMWLLSPILTLHWYFLMLEQNGSRKTIVFKYLTTLKLFFSILNFEKKSSSIVSSVSLSIVVSQASDLLTLIYPLADLASVYMMCPKTRP